MVSHGRFFLVDRRSDLLVILSTLLRKNRQTFNSFFIFFFIFLSNIGYQAVVFNIADAVSTLPFLCIRGLGQRERKKVKERPDQAHESAVDCKRLVWRTQMMGTPLTAKSLSRLLAISSSIFSFFFFEEIAQWVYTLRSLTIRAGIERFVKGQKN